MFLLDATLNEQLHNTGRSLNERSALCLGCAHLISNPIKFNARNTL